MAKLMTWEEVAAFLGCGKYSWLQSGIPSVMHKKHKFYERSEVLKYVGIGKRKRGGNKITHCKGKDAWQALARTVILFAISEADIPVQNVIGLNGERIREEARNFLSEESEYQELLEDVAEWKDVFRIWRRKNLGENE